MKGFYRYRTQRLLPLCVLAASFITLSFFLISFFHYTKNIYNKKTFFIILSVITLLWLFLIPLGIKTDKQGIYLNNEFIIWQQLFKSKAYDIRDIKGIVILHNITQKAALGTTVPVFETVRTDFGIEYIYSIVLINDLTKANFNYSSNLAFINDHRDIVVGCAIYNKILTEELLKKNNKIRIIKGNLTKGNSSI